MRIVKGFESFSQAQPGEVMISELEQRYVKSKDVN